MSGVDDIEPGIALDRRIAALLGYQITVAGHHCIEVDPEDAIIGEAWSPSTRIADAWELTEYLRPRFHFEISHYQDDELVRWQASFRDGRHVASAFAETAPLAICRAAVLVVGT